MSDLPSVSIVTPTFNHARYIEATIRSVLNQNYPNLQYVVMDGASKDGTVEILKKYASVGGLPASAGSTNFSWQSAPDQGQADAINKGFARCTGEIIAWLNSDDCYKPGAILAAATYLRDHPTIPLVYGNAEFIRPDGSYLCPCANTEPFSRHRLVHYSDYIVQPSTFFRLSAFQAVGGLDTSLHYAMDYDLWLKLSAGQELAYVPQVWSQYRWLGENKSATGSWKRIEEVRQVAKRHGSNRLPAYFRLEAVNLHVQSARASWRKGEVGSAAVSLAYAIANTISSPRALWSLLHRQTRRIIATGRILRQSTNTIEPQMDADERR